MGDNIDRDHKTSSEADASYYCTDCGQDFKSLQESKKHKRNRNKFNLKSLIGYVLLFDRLTLSF